MLLLWGVGGGGGHGGGVHWSPLVCCLFTRILNTERNLLGTVFILTFYFFHCVWLNLSRKKLIQYYEYWNKSKLILLSQVVSPVTSVSMGSFWKWPNSVLLVDEQQGILHVDLSHAVSSGQYWNLSSVQGWCQQWLLLAVIFSSAWQWCNDYAAGSSLRLQITY